jgi:ring-1,2-phenylacetyl-CoA epoxidase subunit PaaC
MASDRQVLDYVLRLADSDLILAQRLGEWVGHGPVLEEDIALTNVGLDLLGQARLWFAYAAEIEVRVVRASSGGAARGEDEFAFLRESGDFRNLLLAEQPNGNYADTTARQFYFDVWHELLLKNLVHSRDGRIGEIASKALKEVTYHAERSADWVIRLGDGTELSHARMQSAIDALWMYTGEMFAADETEQALAAEGVAADVAALLPPWRDRVAAVLDEATLAMPSTTWMQRGGKQGVHTEHLSHLLAEMQSLHRAHPGAQW